jgi:ABC-type glycerol-3-phosphate transport system substrate-binding protein
MRATPARDRPGKPDPHTVGYIVVMAVPGETAMFMGWCPMEGVAGLAARVRATHPSAQITDWFPSTRRIGHWHHKGLIPARVAADNADWYQLTPAFTGYLEALRAQYPIPQTARDQPPLENQDR